MLIENAELAAPQLPEPTATVEQRDKFAQTVDGYEQWGDALAPMANAAVEQWTSSGVLPASVTELRGCLFFEQRRRNHVGEGIEEEQRPYEDAIYARLAELIEQGEIDREAETVTAWTRDHPGMEQPVADWIHATSTTLESGDVLPRDLREHHLSEALKSQINAERPGCAQTRVLKIDAWPLLGRSGTDVVVYDQSNHATPEVLFELKWCQQGSDKVHEAIWDLFKIALAAGQYGASGYLVTAAPPDIWEAALCGELFSDGEHDSAELMTRTFPNGTTVWDWLLEGGYDRYPAAVPSTTRTTEIARATASFGALEWELRAVSVSPGPERLELADGWPPGARPASAIHPPM